MPSQRRLYVPGGIYHVILRGNNRRALFHTESDRLLLEHLFATASERYGCRIHAYCWMTNHLHLAVQVSDVALSSFVQYAASIYAKRFNVSYGRTGHLFERRHRAILVDGDAYLSAIVRYIHRNPIDARMVQCATDYRWCSHGTYLGRSSVPWLTTDLVLSIFDDNRARAQSLFDRYVHDARESEPELNTHSQDNRILGDDEFLERMIKAADRQCHSPSRSLGDLVFEYCEFHRVNCDSLKCAHKGLVNSKHRSEIAELALAEGVASLTEIAQFFNRSGTVVLRSLQRHQAAKSTKSPPG